jgi:hypothetical protein
VNVKRQINRSAQHHSTPCIAQGKRCGLPCRGSKTKSEQCVTKIHIRSRLSARFLHKTHRKRLSIRLQP